MAKKLDRSKLNDVERDLLAGMEGFLADLKSDENITEKYTCRTVVLDLEPTYYSADEVKATRKLLKVSQALFAHFLGVSPKSVRAWESNKNSPSDIACRFMDEIQRNPEHWKARLKESIRVKTS